MRQNRPTYSEETDEQRRRHNARAYARVYERRGKITKQPCRACGASDSQKHHTDYSQPLLIEWLCRPCHLALHREQELAPLRLAA